MDEEKDRASSSTFDELIRKAGIAPAARGNDPHDLGPPPRVAFTMGDLNGIGIEVMVKALIREEVRGACRPVIVGNTLLIKSYLHALPIAGVQVGEGALIIGTTRIPIHDIPSDATLEFGEIDARAGKLAGDAVIQAATMARKGEVDAIVTMPISKRSLNAGGHDYPGHTEMLAAVAGGEPLMILLTKGMRVAIVTIHMPLSQVPAMLTWDLIERRARQLTRSLRLDFGVEEPRIAAFGLNPHAGENGLIGREESEIIAPTLASLRSAGIRIDGPLPADGFFARFIPGEYDAILAMYHDQGLIPLKLFARGAGVNFTAGLPIVRTSPDHGTAYNIAGHGIADDRSVVEAVLTAVEVVRNRVKRL